MGFRHHPILDNAVRRDPDEPLFGYGTFFDDLEDDMLTLPMRRLELLYPELVFGVTVAPKKPTGKVKVVNIGRKLWRCAAWRTSR